MYAFFSAWLVPILLGGLLGLPGLSKAEFVPPRIIQVVHSFDVGEPPDSLANPLRYYINKGVGSNINKGDVLNVYREKRLSRQIARPLRLFIGTMTIIEAHPGSSFGIFTLNAAALGQPMIRYKTAIKNDMLVPRLVIDARVLFDPGQATLRPGVAQEFQKAADFVQNFSPSKLMIEGHTDSDGDNDANEKLSERRAKVVRTYLINAYGFIPPAMVEARGYGEERPLVPNDTPESKTLNQRIEVLVWE